MFWISGDVSSGFQSQSGFCLIRYFCGGECNVHSPRFTSGATLANLLAAGAQPVTSPHACAEVGLGSDSNVQSKVLSVLNFKNILKFIEADKASKRTSVRLVGILYLPL